MVQAPGRDATERLPREAFLLIHGLEVPEVPTGSIMDGGRDRWRDEIMVFIYIFFNYFTFILCIMLQQKDAATQSLYKSCKIGRNSQKS